MDEHEQSAGEMSEVAPIWRVKTPANLDSITRSREPTEQQGSERDGAHHSDWHAPIDFDLAHAAVGAVASTSLETRLALKRAVNALEDKARDQSHFLVNVGEQKRRSDRWIHSQNADLLFGGVICLNACVLAIETDYRPENEEFQPMWFTIDSFFNAVFLVECFLRAYAERTSWCRDAWNVFDAFLVSIGVLDVWIFGLIGLGGQARILTLSRMFKLLRLARILRILRLFRFLKELVLLTQAIVGAMAAMVWSLMLICVVLIIGAMFTTRVIGRDCCEPGATFQNTHGGEWDAWFGTLPRSLFTLFQIMTLENWPNIARPAQEQSVWLVIFFIVFIMFTNITLMNTVAGVVCENVLCIAAREEEVQKAEVEKKRKDTCKTLREAFAKLDLDRSGSLEFAEVMANPDTHTIIKDALVQMQMSAVDVKDLFQVLDVDGSGTITQDEFVDGIMMTPKSPIAVHMLTLRSEVGRISTKLQDAVVQLKGLDQQVKELHEAMCGLGGLSSPPSTNSTPTIDTRLTRPPADAPTPGGAPGSEASAQLAALRYEMHAELAAFQARVISQLKAARLAQGGAPRRRGGREPPIEDERPFADISRSVSLPMPLMLPMPEGEDEAAPC
eukprot:gnl/TRDRNA2_/TRDRNA2_112694_c0_seq1.p1 gnl/TRDRNA2_/TRDRNA2_112694_c0~~gnl/TRDRNA2_/TRDRNA2_112694_c0_seq1.p1  ORF type:complete len:616 (-),score=123.17 gnl/TRDRNA2_/TRDRNA2_112694_c0_seq1:21-1868(-)